MKTSVMCAIMVVAAAGAMMAFAIAGCTPRGQQQQEEEGRDSSAYFDPEEFIEKLLEEEEEDTAFKSLNEIRFKGWTDEDWEDNDYYRTLRSYIDAFLEGEIEDEDLYAYKKVMHGQFICMRIFPSLVGGVLIDFLFIDHPKYDFLAWVYSDVDMETETVFGYRVMSIVCEDENCDYFNNTEEVNQSILDNPQCLVW